MLLVFNGAMFAMMYALHSRMLVSWSLIALPLLAKQLVGAWAGAASVALGSPAPGRPSGMLNGC